MKYWLERPERIWDRGGKRVFAIIAMPRSGSNYLQRTIDTLGDVFCHGELFNQGRIGFHHKSNAGFAGYADTDLERRAADPETFFTTVIAHAPQPIVGFRLFAQHVRPALINALYDRGVQKIILRRNYLHSYISLEVAKVTGRWIRASNSSKDPGAKIAFDIAEFLRLVAINSLFYNDVLNLLTADCQPFFSIDYSQINDLHTLNAMASFIGSAECFQSVPTTIFRQNEAPLEEIVINHRQMIQEIRNVGLERYVL